tara:strand:- start:4244 stop:4654 length:411 start_codon:yes stop_codon:yes gene_type:complete
MNFYIFWNKIGKLKISKIIYQISRDFCQNTRITKHSGRQDFHLGYLKKGFQSKLKSHLSKNKFEKSYFSWIDDGEILSLRKLDNKGCQYHIRLFNDREIRVHYEFAPDGHPIKHLREDCFKPKRNHFSSLIKGFLQ